MKNKKRELTFTPILVRSALLIVGVFLLAMTYNLIIGPNQLVIGGMTGLSVVIGSITDINSVFFLYIFNFALIIVSFIVLGVKKTWRTIIGSLLYPIMITCTVPLASYINLNLDNDIIIILLCGIITGVGNGLVYKAGYTTGGSDVIIQTIGEKKKTSMGTATLITNMTIILFGGYILGFNKAIYAILILFINSYLVDRIMLGISNSKMFYIYTKEVKKVKKFIMKDINTGVTILSIEGGFTKRRSKMIMCVVRSRDYFLFKEKILSIDPTAFLVINDCYEVTGGVKRNNLPFFNQ